MGSLRFSILYSLMALLLLGVILSAFILHNIFSWTVGLIYIAYDSFIQCVVVSITSKRLKQEVSQEIPKSSDPRLPTIAVVIPARNEMAVLSPCLTSILGQTCLPDEIIIVDDGSTDGTVEWLTSRFQMKFGFAASHAGNRADSLNQSILHLIAKAHTGKADSLNAGWQSANSEIVVTIDADTVLNSDALMEVSLAFAKDPHLTAGGGVIIPRCSGSITAKFFQFFQTFEYCRSFLERFAWMSNRTLALVSGAFSAFRRSELQKLGGFNKESSVEDYELIYRFYRHYFDRGLEPDIQVLGQAHAVTDAPPNFEKFLLQRSRWFAGFLDTLFRNKDMIGNPKYGRFGRWMLVLKLFDTLRPIYGLLALAVFIVYLTLGFRPYIAILYVMIAKLMFDFLMHCYAFNLYNRWQKKRIALRNWGQSILAILMEPFSFQILRHVAAVFGVFAYLGGRIRWAQQRQSA